MMDSAKSEDEQLRAFADADINAGLYAKDGVWWYMRRYILFIGIEKIRWQDVVWWHTRRYEWHDMNGM